MSALWASDGVVHPSDWLEFGTFSGVPLCFQGLECSSAVSLGRKLRQSVAVPDEGPSPREQFLNEGLAVQRLQLNGQYADGDFRLRRLVTHLLLVPVTAAKHVERGAH